MGQEKNIHGPEALECSGPEWNRAQAAVCKRNKRTEQNRGAEEKEMGNPGFDHRTFWCVRWALTTALVLCLWLNRKIRVYE